MGMTSSARISRGGVRRAPSASGISTLGKIWLALRMFIQNIFFYVLLVGVWAIATATLKAIVPGHAWIATLLCILLLQPFYDGFVAWSIANHAKSFGRRIAGSLSAGKRSFVGMLGAAVAMYGIKSIFLPFVLLSAGWGEALGGKWDVWFGVGSSLLFGLVLVVVLPRFSYVRYMIVVENVPFLASLKMSWQSTRRVWVSLMVAYFVLCLPAVVLPTIMGVISGAGEGSGEVVAQVKPLIPFVYGVLGFPLLIIHYLFYRESGGVRRPNFHRRGRTMGGR